jgi:hypothetical protein
MKKRIQMFGAELFIVGALAFAGLQTITPVAEARQGQPIGCCVYPTDCASGMSCTGSASGCPAQNPSYVGRCQETPKDPAPAPPPTPIENDN